MHAGTCSLSKASSSFSSLSSFNHQVHHHTDLLVHYDLIKMGAFVSRAAQPARYTLVFHAEPQFVDTVKQAVFAAGAGRYPNYSECCWTATGTGQFRPIGAANPHTGEVGVLEKIEELRVEMLCDSEETARKAVEALKK